VTQRESKILNRHELEYSITSLAKMYRLRDQIAAQTIGHASTREAEVDGVVSMIRKIEREVAEYLATHLEEYRDADEAAGSAREPVAA
jgi:hypothetical protein